MVVVAVSLRPVVHSRMQFWVFALAVLMLHCYTLLFRGMVMCSSCLVGQCFGVVGMCIVSSEGGRPVLLSLISFIERLTSLPLSSQNNSQWYSKVIYRLMWLQRFWQLANFPKFWTISSNSLIQIFFLSCLLRNGIFHFINSLYWVTSETPKSSFLSLFRFFIPISALLFKSLLSLSYICLSQVLFLESKSPSHNSTQINWHLAIS